MTNDVFIDNQWLPGTDGEFDVVDPATADSIRAVSNGGVADATAAVDAAAAAQGRPARAQRDPAPDLRADDPRP
jgi:acyl-CoA reductase-like NAD-dependent aldehyde dehydrogenase